MGPSPKEKKAGPSANPPTKAQHKKRGLHTTHHHYNKSDRWHLNSLAIVTQHSLRESQEPSTMVTMNNNNIQETTPTASSDYEKCREERIKENLERMQKLGIYDLSLKLKSVKPNSYRKNNKLLSNNQIKTPDNRCIPPLPSSVPTRRSSRLQSTPAVSYAEVDVSKPGKNVDDLLMSKNPRPEVYTEEHEKLLGEAKTEWTLFVDGYGKDGKRIYDQVRGKTCHQCRQKTLGHRTHCIQCNLVQGQFCGDCLYMRYGENVLEAKQNPDWICPVCRGICNCSLCRQAKGWAATGMLYRKISSQGYKSVAHYLIQTRRSDPNIETNEKSDTQVCAKRSLPFSKEEGVAEGVAEKSENVELKEKNPEEEVNNEKPPELQSTDKSEAILAKNESFESNDKNLEAEVNSDEKPPELQSSDKSETEVNEGENEKSELTNGEDKVNNTIEEVKTVVLTPETKPGSRKKRCSIVLGDSIAGRLRSRRARA
ncbi:putative transcription factor C2H2 family [Helianthus annuus]|nr:putative transcription factor C2H2 family [Helianthus annuus]KAJ0843799.1 putative transcription factor C2H2 family [Helianthus annuus]